MKDSWDTQDIVVMSFRKVRDALRLISAIEATKMVNMNSKDRFDGQIENIESVHSQTEDMDVMMEEILQNINSTPIGQVIKKIASLPEVRQEKIIDVRGKLNNGCYDLNQRLDIALEKVLDDLAI